jgi:zinc protease
MQIVAITRNAAAFKNRLLSGAPTPMQYNSPKPQAILDEDNVVERFAVPVKPAAITIVRAERIFE